MWGVCLFLSCVNVIVQGSVCFVFVGVCVWYLCECLRACVCAIIFVCVCVLVVLVCSWV